MGWVYRYEEQHRCQLPPMDRSVHPGDVRQCDVCQQFYRARDDQRDGPYMELVSSAEIPDVFNEQVKRT